MKLGKHLPLLLILTLAALLRLWHLDQLPPSLNWDEVSHGFNAYSILKTGRDEWGTTLPLIFRAYGDFKLPLYIYLSTIPVFLFGLNPFSVRLLSVLSGLGLVLVAYLLGKNLGKNRQTGYLSALLTAISPWPLFLSRVAVEANLAAFLFSLGAYFTIIALKKDQKKPLFLAFFLWGLSLHTYNSARILVPISLLFLFLLFLKQKKLKNFFTASSLILIFSLPIFFQLFNKSASARFSWVTLVDQGAINEIIEDRQSSSLPAPISRLIYNRPSYFLSHSAKNYILHFSPSFLFKGGGSHYQFSLPGFGLLYLVCAPFILWGACFLLKQKQFLPLFFVAIAFLPSAITRDSPHVLRSLFVLPWPLVLSALGVSRCQLFLKRNSRLGGRLFLFTFLASLLISFSLWWRAYQKDYSFNYSWAWQYGYKEAVNYVKENYEDYDKIVFTKKYGEPHEFILFNWPWDPKAYQSDPHKIWDYHSQWYWVDAFDKFEFLNDWELKEKLSPQSGEKLLLVTSPGNWPQGGELLETVNLLDHSPVFEILKY